MMPAGERKGIEILYRDHLYAVVNKPAGELSNGPSSLETRLRSDWSNRELGAVHRLDRDTSGCLLFALTTQALESGFELFRTRKVTKEYLVLVTGEITERKFDVREPIENQAATTSFRRLQAGKQASLLSAELHTGRTHQIRKHLASIAHPVVGDRVYHTSPVQAPAARSTARQMLHAFRLSFPHPSLGRTVSVTAPPPDDFMQAASALGLNVGRTVRK